MAINTNKTSETKEYYCLINEVQYGPYDVATLISKIDRNTIVWRDGIEWIKASEVIELKKFFPEPELVVVQNTATKSKETTPSNSYPGLYCSSDEKVIFGLCGGLSHKFGVPVALIRIIAFFTAGFCYAYIIGIFLPKNPTKK
jgi:phage shock protein PspC (stress-responsive transcriptional regulator)